MKFKVPLSISTIIITASFFFNPMTGYGAEPAPKPVTPESNLSVSPAVSEDIPSLIKDLGSKEYAARTRAISSLEKIGAPAVPSLIEALTDTNSYTRKGATEALGVIGNVSPEVIPSLIKTLIDRDSYVRKSSAEALGKIGATSVPYIIKALSDNNSLVRKGAIDALGNMGIVTPELVPALINALEDEDASVRKSAVEALDRIGPVTPEVIPALKKMLGDSDYNVRKSAMEILEKKGALTQDLKIKRHILDLSDSNADIRKGAIDLLNRMGASTPEVNSAIIKAMEDKDYSVRKSSADFLERKGSLTAALKAKRYMLDLKYGNKIIRMKAAENLGKLGAVTPEVVPALISAMEDKDIHDTAIEAIGNIGSAAKEAVPSLTKALADSDSNVRMLAADALGKIGPSAKNAVPALIKALRDTDYATRKSAADALKKLNAMTMQVKINYFFSAHPIISTFSGIVVSIALLFAVWFAVPLAWRIFHPTGWYIHELHNIDIQRRISAAQALGKIGKPAVQSLIKALSHKKGDVRIGAAEALNNIGAMPPKAIPIILRSLRDKESEVRRNITEVLGKADPETPDLVPALIRMLGDNDSSVRESAAEALGKTGPETPEVVPALMKALGDSFHQVRTSAASALEKCGAMNTELKVKRCITDFRDTQTDILSKAIEELENIGPAAIPELIKALGDANSHIRRFAAAALEKQNALSVELKVKRYILDLADNHTSVRTRAAEALGNMGNAASDAIPHLTKLIGNKDYYARWHAAEALEKLGALTTDLKVKRYILDLGDSNAEVRSKAAEALCELGPDAKEALPKLKKLLTEEDEIIRTAAENAIAKIEPVQTSTAS